MAETKKARAIAKTKKIIQVLRKLYPEAHTALEFRNPLQLLVSTILSAQCTDVRVNMVTPELFSRYRTAADFASADQSELEEIIRSTGFYRNKARSIIACCERIQQQFHGVVPSTMADLTSLAGVGRKTANCVLGGAFGINSGIVVDTHVERLAGRLGLSSGMNPEAIEQDLMKLVPKKERYVFSNWLILHGRAVCNARKPNCPECPLRLYCPSATSFIRSLWPKAIRSSDTKTN